MLQSTSKHGVGTKLYECSELVVRRMTYSTQDGHSLRHSLFGGKAEGPTKERYQDTTPILLNNATGSGE